MKVNIKLYVKDRWAAERDNSKYIEGFNTEEEPFFLDGPVTSQVAIIDFDPETGALTPGAKFQPAGGSRKLGRYLIKDENDLDARDLNQVCAFGTVYNTIQMFRHPDALGRDITWAFGAPQLLVIPRAGDMANAYYERDSHALQFFFFDHPRKPGQKVYTSQSRDIITHETGHAILDGILPSLYNAITPQSLALHEGFADLVATLGAFDSHELAIIALKKSNGSLESSTEFSALAEEFGNALDRTGLQGYLRNLYNKKTLDPNDQSLDDAGKPNLVRRAEPHELSQVVSGALYAIMVKMHTARTAELAQASGKSDFSSSGKALAITAGQFKRRLIRALDYAPNGEISFADYGRAILAADRVANQGSEDTIVRKTLVDEFVRRKIVQDAQALEVHFNPDEPAVKALDLNQLIASDWVAYQFANNNRKLLHIPADVDFKVWPRLDVRKQYWFDGQPTLIRECLFKVSWYATEPNNLGPMFPAGRQVQVGTTLAIDWRTGQINSLLTSDHAGEPEGEEQRGDRSEMLRQVAGEGILRPAAFSGPDGNELLSAISFDTPENAMRVSGSAKMLHIVERM